MKKGFTLIELLVVIAIIGLLASITLASLESARTKARDAKRFGDMRNVIVALDMYYDENGQYPITDSDGCGGWDIGNTEHQLLNRSGQTLNAMPDPPEDPTATGNCAGYRYYRYPAGYQNCPTERGAFYVLGITDTETSGRPHPTSPGWSCPTRNWQNEFDWVVGKFEH